MAKPPVTENRFRIHCETSKGELGSLLEWLAIMGYDNVGYELITDVVTFNHRPRKVYDIDNAEFAMAWIDEHPDFSRGQLIEHFKAHGREAGTAGTVLQRLSEQGAVTRIVPGRYRKALKALPPPRKQPPSKPTQKPKIAPEPPRKKTRPPNPTARYDVSNKDLILRFMDGRDEFNTSELVDLFKANGRPPKSISPQVYMMTQEKLIKKLTEGQYQVLAKGKKASAGSAQASITESTTQEG